MKLAVILLAITAASLSLAFLRRPRRHSLPPDDGPVWVDGTDPYLEGFRVVYRALPGAARG